MGLLQDDVRRAAEQLIKQAESTLDTEEKARLLKRAEDLLASLDFLNQSPAASAGEQVGRRSDV
jgi:hypothetical protein